jgi:uncharacterized protein
MQTELIIDKFYNKENGALRSILLTHSRKVAEKAVRIAEAHPELDIDKQFVYDAAMLHDIGIIMCDAPDIKCFGTEHYMRHGICGGQMLRSHAAEWGMTAEEAEPYARVCERHTGAGLTAKDIKEQHMPLPPVDLLPETLEEKLICYADKFFSKTRLTEEKPLDRVIHSMQKFGADTERRFLKLHELFR